MLDELEKRIEDIENSIALDLELHGPVIDGKEQFVDCALSLSLYERRLRVLELCEFREKEFGIDDGRIAHYKERIKEHKDFTLRCMLKRYGIQPSENY